MENIDLLRFPRASGGSLQNGRRHAQIRARRRELWPAFSDCSGPLCARGTIAIVRLDKAQVGLLAGWLAGGLAAVLLPLLLLLVLL
jgi:hypothetical protein